MSNERHPITSGGRLDVDKGELRTASAVDGPDVQVRAVRAPENDSAVAVTLFYASGEARVELTEDEALALEDLIHQALEAEPLEA